MSHTKQKHQHSDSPVGVDGHLFSVADGGVGGGREEHVRMRRKIGYFSC